MDFKDLKQAIENNDMEEVEARFTLIENHVDLFYKHYGENPSVADMITFIRQGTKRVKDYMEKKEKKYTEIELDMKYIFCMLNDLFKYDLEIH